MINPDVFPREFLEFVRYGAITGFIAVTTLVININHKAFNTIFREKARSFWWLFVISGIIPLLLFLYAFTLIFDHWDFLK
ncbi:hypothetical protein A2962_02320 [Candidatus Woesebacteria bacterium RIFCSPLOWO2_01_FULL_39_61]|uniref:DUF5671 domain-containing protein n=1 Tax=Candidatus Woesebacteria bacterium RIFCSPHIGHO2_02_FULL_39_13 TaxID=1802505 RepID=A0A1F7Z5G0_9BACT|nr:MAG: hypothetical protein A2692_01335 [Candidatus Woesebacteria bacterium RIFCSPHIGHO2_01_FULL_39_95]OGM33995.1 MAG: hypothetical protein A3D01_03625 [Candidatus Woesebacteria bacterium RIFCSPHIGHO2_02_FULL_39_13]OGM38253.1 MAG: hypothetical protein A3E13_05735 [Candidatus Woesebacteria bacterium RIFCSPHIGHO2_12_FULL_40_20]OGM66959.1 MAG: hypothetical protein A2962_02320 [Candidatus Woesebacteria bacterium RIFCSPLOWO2_01_FULL_39_61]OGM75509.1 MAG: hypothetical protein A3H19_00590 [Candidatus